MACILPNSRLCGSYNPEDKVMVQSEFTLLQYQQEPGFFAILQIPTSLMNQKFGDSPFQTPLERALLFNRGIRTRSYYD